jgi:hypothetical protein
MTQLSVIDWVGGCGTLMTMTSSRLTAGKGKPAKPSGPGLGGWLDNN